MWSKKFEKIWKKLNKNRLNSASFLSFVSDLFILKYYVAANQPILGRHKWLAQDYLKNNKCRERKNVIKYWLRVSKLNFLGSRKRVELVIKKLIDFSWSIESTIGYKKHTEAKYFSACQIMSELINEVRAERCLLKQNYFHVKDAH